jgi:hypothetical protein
MGDKIVGIYVQGGIYDRGRELGHAMAAPDIPGVGVRWQNGGFLMKPRPVWTGKFEGSRILEVREFSLDEFIKDWRTQRGQAIPKPSP